MVLNEGSSSRAVSCTQLVYMPKAREQVGSGIRKGQLKTSRALRSRPSCNRRRGRSRQAGTTASRGVGLNLERRDRAHARAWRRRGMREDDAVGKPDMLQESTLYILHLFRPINELKGCRECALRRISASLCPEYAQNSTRNTIFKKSTTTIDFHKSWFWAEIGLFTTL